MRKMLFFALAFALGLPLAAQEKGKSSFSLWSMS